MEFILVLFVVSSMLNVVVHADGCIYQLGIPVNASINECSTQNGGCYLGVSCTELAPIFPNYTQRTCGPCPPGMLGDGVTCNVPNRCLSNNGNCSIITTETAMACMELDGVNTVPCGSCPSGFIKVDDYNCGNINECATGNGGCPSRCSDTYGSHVCSTFGIQPICSDNNGGCDPQTVCTNTGTKSNCAACPSAVSDAGFAANPNIPQSVARPYAVGTGDAGRTNSLMGRCTPINECLLPHACSPHATCTDLTPAPVGPFFGQDPIPPGPHGTYGGWQCKCNDDTTAPGESDAAYGLGGNCSIAEICANNCDPLVICLQGNPASPCLPCPPGYTGNGYLPSSTINTGVTNTGCIRIPHCNIANGGCTPYQRCIDNFDASITCNCTGVVSSSTSASSTGDALPSSSAAVSSSSAPAALSSTAVASSSAVVASSSAAPSSAVVASSSAALSSTASVSSSAVETPSSTAMVSSSAVEALSSTAAASSSTVAASSSAAVASSSAVAAAAAAAASSGLSTGAVAGIAVAAGVVGTVILALGLYAGGCCAGGGAAAPVGIMGAFPNTDYQSLVDCTRERGTEMPSTRQKRLGLKL